MLTEEWIMAETRQTNEGRWALTGCVGRGSIWWVGGLVLDECSDF